MSDEFADFPGIPKSITREQFTALVEGAGFKVKDLVSLEFKYNGIFAEVRAYNEQGHAYTVDGETVATHRVCIPVVESGMHYALKEGGHFQRGDFREKS